MTGKGRRSEVSWNLVYHVIRTFPKFQTRDSSHPAIIRTFHFVLRVGILFSAGSQWVRYLTSGTFVEHRRTSVFRPEDPVRGVN